MAKNFDTTNGQPFVYFDVMGVIQTPETGDVTVTYCNHLALKDSDGVTRILDAETEIHTFVIKKTNLKDEIDLIDLSTGAHLPQKTTYSQALLGTISCIRAHQESTDG